MPRVVFRNRLDTDQPVQITTGAGRMVHTGLTPQLTQAHIAQPGIGRLIHTGQVPTIPRLVSTPVGRLVHTGRLPTSSVSGGGGGGAGGNLFNSGWEFATGCSVNALLDGSPGTKWNDGGGMDCTGRGGLPVTEITTAQSVDGGNSCRVWQMPGNQNGTDFRVTKSFAVQTNVMYVRFYIRWGNNWHWGTSDHKMMIMGHLGLETQELYLNIRADFSSGFNPNAGRLTVGHQAVDSVWTDNRISQLMVKNTWYRIEAKITFGTNGSIECRQNGVPFVPTFDAGTGPTNIMNHPVGLNGYTYVKMDSTYNQGSAITEPMDQYWDAVAVGNQDWIGAV